MKGIVILLFVVCAAVVRAQVDKCPPEQEIDWEIEMLLRHEHCDKFYKCTFGKPVEMQCPSDLYFNLETWQCDWKHNVDCTDRVIPEEDLTTATTNTTTTSVPTTTTSTTTTTTPRPTTTSTTTTTRRPTTTSSTTTTTPRPTTTSTTTTTTPRPTTTSTTTTTTPRPTTTSTTTTTPRPTTTSTTTTTPRPTTTSTTTTTPRPTTTSTTTTTTPAPTTSTTTESPDEFRPNGCPVNPFIHWLLPHETDCNAFYYCVWGRLVLRKCPSTLHFNRIIQVCDWPWDAGCPVTLNKHLDSRQLMR